MGTSAQRPAVTAWRAAPAPAPLFRPEAMAEQQTQWLGPVLLAPQLSHHLFAAFAALAAAGLVALLIFGDYTRKERISGWLVPQEGLVRIFAPQPAVITRLDVQEGSEVHQGEPLLVLSTETQSEALGATQGEIVRQLVSRRDSMAAERALHDQLYRQQAAGLAGRLEALAAEQTFLDHELELQRSRLQLAEQAIERLQPLHDAGLLTEQRWQESMDRRLDHALSLRILERNRAAMNRERLTLQDQLDALPLQNRTQLAAIDRNVAALEQELAATEARRQIVIPAPHDGTVTALQVEQSGSVGTTVPLLTILPAGSELEAELFVRSTAIGFVRPGQRVLLRYRAFPYQKFGHYEGTVASVSRSAVTPGELPQRLSGLTSLYGADEPVYPVVVRLARQSAIVYGEPVALQPGMQLEADVLIENRRLIEWVLEPLYTLTGRWHG